MQSDPSRDQKRPTTVHCSVPTCSPAFCHCRHGVLEFRGTPLLHRGGNRIFPRSVSECPRPRLAEKRIYFLPQNGSEICHVGELLPPFLSTCVPLTESLHALGIILIAPDFNFGYPLNSVWCPPQYGGLQFQPLQRISMGIGYSAGLVLPCRKLGKLSA